MYVCLFKTKSCLKNISFMTGFPIYMRISKLVEYKTLQGNGFILEQPSIARYKKLLHNKAKINSADSDFVAKPSGTCYSSEEDSRHAKIPWRLLHTSLPSGLLDGDGVC